MRNFIFGVLIFISIAIPQWPRFGIDVDATNSGGTGVLPSQDCSSIQYVAATKTFSCAGPAVSGIPSGTILTIRTGVCPATFTEVSQFNGKTLVGTLAANGDIAGTGGLDSIIPQGSVGAPVVSWPAGVPVNGSIGLGSFVSTANATTGNCAATNLAIGTGALTACKATAPNLVVPAQGHSGSLTPSTISWPAGVPTNSVPAFIGTSFDNRSAYVKVIYCSKN